MTTLTAFPTPTKELTSLRAMEKSSPQELVPATQWFEQSIVEIPYSGWIGKE